MTLRLHRYDLPLFFSPSKYNAEHSLQPNAEVLAAVQETEVEIDWSGSVTFSGGTHLAYFLKNSCSHSATPPLSSEGQGCLSS